MNLDTGTISTPNSPTTMTSNGAVDNIPMERVVYPSHKDQHIHVAPDQMVVITAYSIVSSVYVRKLLISSGVPETGTVGCCNKSSSVASQVLNRVTIPQYTMCRDVPMVVISIPGLYEISPSTPNDDLVVTATHYSLQPQGPTANPCCTTC